MESTSASIHRQCFLFLVFELLRIYTCTHTSPSPRSFLRLRHSFTTILNVLLIKHSILTLILPPPRCKLFAVNLLHRFRLRPLRETYCFCLLLPLKHHHLFLAFPSIRKSFPVPLRSPKLEENDVTISYAIQLALLLILSSTFHRILRSQLLVVLKFHYLRAHESFLKVRMDSSSRLRC